MLLYKVLRKPFPIALQVNLGLWPNMIKRLISDPIVGLPVQIRRRLLLLLPWLVKPLRHSFYHLSEPVEIQYDQQCVASQVDTCQNHWQALVFVGCPGDLANALRHLLRIFSCAEMLNRLPNVYIYVDRLVRSPDQTAETKGRNQNDPVVPLRLGSGHAQLIEEPMEIEKRRG